MKPRRAVLGGFMLAALALTVHAAPEKGPVYNTPREVFNAAKAAGKKNDFAGFYACLSPASQQLMAGQMVVGGLSFKQFAATEPTGKAKEAVKPLDDLFKKHGLTDDVLKQIKPGKDLQEEVKNLRAIADKITDRAGFCAAFMALAQKNGPQKHAGPYDNADLTDVNETGAKATGTIVYKVDGKEIKEPIEFAKVGGSWRLVAPEPRAGGPPPARPAP